MTFNWVLCIMTQGYYTTKLIDWVKVLHPTRHTSQQLLDRQWEVEHHVQGHRSFWKLSSQPISWPGTEETKPNTTKVSNTGIKWSKLTQKISPIRDWLLTLHNWRFCQVQSHETYSSVGKILQKYTVNYHNQHFYLWRFGLYQRPSSEWRLLTSSIKRCRWTWYKKCRNT